MLGGVAPGECRNPWPATIRGLKNEALPRTGEGLDEEEGAGTA